MKSQLFNMPLKFSGYKDSRMRYEWNEWNWGHRMVDVSVDYCSEVSSSLTGTNRRQKHNKDYALQSVHATRVQQHRNVDNGTATP